METKILKIENCKLQIANWTGRASPFPNLQFSIFNLQFAILFLLLLSASRLSAAPPASLEPPGSESWPTFRNGNQQLGVAKTKLPAKLERLWVHPAGENQAMIKSTAAI